MLTFLIGTILGIMLHKYYPKYNKYLMKLTLDK